MWYEMTDFIKVEIHVYTNYPQRDEGFVHGFPIFKDSFRDEQKALFINLLEYNFRDLANKIWLEMTGKEIDA